MLTGQERTVLGRQDRIEQEKYKVDRTGQSSVVLTGQDRAVLGGQSSVG